jgi:uncharacterized protein YlxW (UPF0749 family)
MNANELANKLDEIYTGTDYEDIKLAATMLRQQAKKIEDLREHNVKLIDDLFSERKEVIRLEAEIEQLKALAISLSHRNANLQYTRIEK